MKQINFVFPLNRPEGPFTIQFQYVPESLDEIKSYAESVIDCIRSTNAKIGLGLDDSTINSMAGDFEDFLVNLWATSRVQGLVNRQLAQPINRLAESFASYASIAEGRVNG